MKQIKISNKRLILIILFIFGIAIMINSGDNSQSVPDSSDSAFILEEKIAYMLERTYKTKDVSVILTFDTYGEKITVYDSVDNKNIFENKADEPFVVSEKLPYVRGALISASGIPDSQTSEIQQAVATLLGISSSKVNVINYDFGG